MKNTHFFYIQVNKNASKLKSGFSYLIISWFCFIILIQLFNNKFYFIIFIVKLDIVICINIESVMDLPWTMKESNTLMVKINVRGSRISTLWYKPIRPWLKILKILFYSKYLMLLGLRNILRLKVQSVQRR